MVTFAIILVVCNAVIVACNFVIWRHDPAEMKYREAKQRCRELMRNEGR